MQSLTRIRTLASWLRKTSKTADQYPRRKQMTGVEIEDAIKFAVGAYPWPSKWTLRLYHLAKGE